MWSLIFYIKTGKNRVPRTDSEKPNASEESPELFLSTYTIGQQEYSSLPSHFNTFVNYDGPVIFGRFKTWDLRTSGPRSTYQMKALDELYTVILIDYLNIHVIHNFLDNF